MGHRVILRGRELTVLALLALDEIAAELRVSVNTVKSHMRAIFSELGVGSRRLAVLTAHERGLLGNQRRSPSAASGDTASPTDSRR